ncbi:MAG TPA: EamA family transporter [Candidatus Paceibacterota bacterium]|nr:EamA family transporter [Candidatus Paceibacterota bacterium]
MNWIVYALLSALFASLVAIFGKIGLKDIDSTLATAIRSVVMALFLVAVSFSLGKFSLLESVNSKTLLFIILSGVAGAISWLFYFFAIKIGPASAVAAIDKTSIAFVFILALIFLGESFTYMKAGGALLVVLGALLMIL